MKWASSWTTSVGLGGRTLEEHEREKYQHYHAEEKSIKKVKFLTFKNYFVEYYRKR